MDGGKVALGVGVVAVSVGGLILWRRRATTPAQPDACDQLGDPKLVAGCKAARGLLGGVVNAVRNATQSRESKNVELNGPVTERIDVGANRGYQDADGTWHRVLIGGVGAIGIRHQNGCVPIPGHPDWDKCAAGTRHIIDNGNLDDAQHFGGSSWWAVRGLQAGYLSTRTLSGDPAHDALTFRPSPQSDPQTWFVRGKRITCPAGTTVNVGRDHREGVPPCGSPTGPASPPPPTVPTTPTTGTTTHVDGGIRVDRRTH